MTREQIRNTALRQSAIDLGCEAGDFLKSENVIVLSRKDERARKYGELPFSCDLVSCGSNIVASVQPAFRELTERYIRSVRNAIRSGFRPAWAELTARPIDFVDGMNAP